ncbi:MAG: S41 family peptidase [Pirellulales bacterium]
MAAALQDHKRAIIVGQRSYGKGTVQHPIPLLPRGDEKGRPPILKLTVAHYYRPNGQNIHRLPDAKESDEWGVTPNEGYVVPLDEKAEKRREAWQRERERSLQNLPAPSPDGKTTVPEPESVFDEKTPDPQLKRAIEAIREQWNTPVPKAA